MNGDDLLAAYPAAQSSELGYDPSEAAGLELIQNSALGLTESELAVLHEKGLVITARQQFPSFAYGYKSIYAEDLPVYVSADSILQAVHVAFDRFLARTEQLALIPDLGLVTVRDDVVIRSVVGATPYRRISAAMLADGYRSPAAEAMLEILAEVGSEFEAGRRELALVS